MSSFRRKRCSASAGVASTASDTASFALGARELDALTTGVSCGYWPARPPLQPVKLVAVVPVHVTTPDEAKTIAFDPALKFAVLETSIVALGSVNGFAVSLAGPESTNDVPAVTVLSRRKSPSRP